MIRIVLKECIAIILQFQVLAHLIVGSECSTFLSMTGVCTYTAVETSKLANLFSSNCSGFKSQ
jgi:hypothetical protein